jgi:formate hydrogenlyase subunit 3/multisubunit Na+/H+ antiporter MnhD subunit
VWNGLLLSAEIVFFVVVATLASAGCCPAHVWLPE